MKTSLTLIALIATSISYCQDIPELSIKITGVEEIIVLVEGKTSSEIYTKSINWIKETYRNPEEVIKMTIENEKIRIEGYQNNAWYYKSLGIKQNYDMVYELQISIKDDRYKLEFIPMKFYTSVGLPAYDYTTFFKANGDTRKTYAPAVESLNQSMNDISTSLYNYVLNGGSDSKEGDW